MLFICKMIVLCSGEDSIYSSSSTGYDVIMMSNCIYGVIIFSSSLFDKTSGIKCKNN